MALKLIKPDISSDKKIIERFKTELKLARKIGHPNVGRMYELLEHEGTHYITMEYVAGQDLKGLIRQSGQLAVGTTISIAKQVCAGLAEAHRLGVVHRDLKPSNIMIDKEGSARIMDFGIARSLKAKGITKAGVMIGTPEYMSPEQIEAKETDQRSDIYSLGVILYEMLTGRLPFEGDTPLSIAVQHRSGTPKDPRALNAQIPEELGLAILKCLEKNKETRYQNAGELSSELEGIEKGIPSTEKEAPKRKPLTSKEITVTLGLKKLFIPVVIVIALIVIGLFFWKPWSRQKQVPIPSDIPSLAIVNFENISSHESLEGWRTGLSELLIIDLMQSKFLNVITRDKIFSILKKFNLVDAKTYTTEDLIRVASEARASHTISGSYIKAGDDIIITLLLQKPQTGEVIESIKVTCRGEDDIATQVDYLTRQIKQELDLSQEQIAVDIDKDAGQITTNSPEALKFYSEGRKLYYAQDRRGSIELMKKAISLDPKFAMAYRSMAGSYHGLALYSEQQKYLEKARSLADRLPDRERFLIEGGISGYSKLLGLYPDDILGNANLGSIFTNLEEWDKAIERYEVCKKNKSKFASSYVQLASAYTAKGNLDKAKEVLEDYIINIADHATIRQSLATNYILRGEFDLALAELDKALSLNPNDLWNYIHKANLYVYSHDLSRAEEEYMKVQKLEGQTTKLAKIIHMTALYFLQGKYTKAKILSEQGLEGAKSINEKYWTQHYQSMLGWINLKTGNLEAALKWCIESWENAKDAATEYYPTPYISINFKGQVLLEMKRIEEAQKTAEELREHIEKGSFRKIKRMYYHLMGMIEQKKENYSKAIEYFQQALSLIPIQRTGAWGINQQAAFIDSLAQAYFESGDLEKAELEYRKILGLTIGRLYQGDIYAKTF